MDLKEKISKLKVIEDKLVERLEEIVNKRMYDEAEKISFLLIKIKSIKP